MFVTPYSNDKLTRQLAEPPYELRDLGDFMSPSHGDVAQTPESKSSSGFASVFKSLTGGGKSTKHNAAVVGSGQRASNAGLPVVDDEPLDFERFCTQLKPGNSLRDRVDAAEALKFAVQDHPLEGVGRLCHAIISLQAADFS